MTFNFSLTEAAREVHLDLNNIGVSVVDEYISASNRLRLQNN